MNATNTTQVQPSPASIEAECRAKVQKITDETNAAMQLAVGSDQEAAGLDAQIEKTDPEAFAFAGLVTKREIARSKAAAYRARAGKMNAEYLEATKAHHRAGVALKQFELEASERRTLELDARLSADLYAVLAPFDDRFRALLAEQGRGRVLMRELASMKGQPDQTASDLAFFSKVTWGGPALRAFDELRAHAHAAADRAANHK